MCLDAPSNPERKEVESTDTLSVINHCRSATHSLPRRSAARFRDLLLRGVVGIPSESHSTF